MRKPLSFFLVAAALGPVAFAQGQGFDFEQFLQALFGGALDTLLSYSQGAIPALVIAFITDRLLKYVPFLAPFREAIKQWVLAKIEELRLQRAKQVVVAAGQAMKAQMQAQTQSIPATDYVPPPPQVITPVPPQILEQLKQRRLADAFAKASKIAGPENARALIEGAVGALKAEGVNP